MAFIDKTEKMLTPRFRSQIPTNRISEFLSMLVDGVGSQMMNCPLDIIASMRIFDKYPEIRPHQIVATIELASAALKSVHVGTTGGFPRNIVRINRTLNAVTFLANRDFLGIDFISQLDIPDDEEKTARKLYGLCKKTLDQFSPGDEWEVVRAFVTEFHCADCFEIVPAVKEDAEQKRQKESTRTFQENFSSEKNPSVNMAVTMHMVEAIKRLQAMPVEEVRRVAAEIALIGTHGISPDKKSGYSVHTLGDEDMSGCRLLAYYYVSWKIGFPEKVHVLGLPFDKEYVQAETLAKAGL